MTAKAPAGAPPLRFLVIVLGGWAVLRAGALLLWPEAAALPETGPAVAEAPARPASSAPARAAQGSVPADDRPWAIRREAHLPARGPVMAAIVPPPPLLLPATSSDRPARAPASPESFAAPLALIPPPPSSATRWSASAWLLARDDGGAAPLAPGGTLGGSQVGARLLYRLGSGLSLSGRLYAPLRRTSGAEAALGLDWHPFPRLPVRLLAERRIGLGRDGRDAFALTLYGGHSARLSGIAVDAYVQAGVVGLKSRDLFVDGAVRAGLPLGPVEIGGGVWGAAQPGAARLDAGPQLSWRLPQARLRVSADWRFRLAGEAAPGSGPALTLGADF